MPQEFLPLLKPQNIDELKSLILQIMEDNDSKLETIIDNRQNYAIQQGQDFTIEDLNDLLSQQCLQKQRIISNLSHFALSLMDTIDVLWQDNEDLEYRVKDQQEIMEEMSIHLQEINKQNELLKNNLHSAFNDLQTIQQQKLKVQEYLSSIIVKHDSSFCLNKSRKKRESTDEQKISEEDKLYQQPIMYFTEDQMIYHGHENQQLIQEVQFEREYQQNAQIMLNKENLDLINRKTCEMDLLQESVIKESISVLRRFTLSDQIQQRLPILQQSKGQIEFINKSHRLSLINQISLQIFQKPQEKLNQKQDLTKNHSLIQIPTFQKHPVKDLRISNQKVNITIATGTDFTKTRDSEKIINEQFSTLHPNTSCNSFMLNCQNSAVMYPSLDRPSSALSFVTQTTKIIQTDPPKDQKTIRKPIINVEKKSIGIDTSTMIQKPVISKTSDTKDSILKKQKNELKIGTQKSQQGDGRKSFGQLLDYFTKKIVSDRIKTGAFKKTKSNVQKVF